MHMIQPPRCSLNAISRAKYTKKNILIFFHQQSLERFNSHAIISCTHNVSQLSNHPGTIIATFSPGIHPEPLTKSSPNELEV